MKSSTKKIILFSTLSLFAFGVNSQNQVATFAPGISPDWKGGTNNPGGGWANTFGTSPSNSNPLYFSTWGLLRGKLNSTYGVGTQYLVNGFSFFNGVNTSGYFLIGGDSPLTTGPGTLINNKGAFSLFHLNGNSGLAAQEFGYRTWMKTGITFTDNNDRAYIGYRANGIDVSDLIINWSDNSVGPFPGPDNLIFNFTSSTGSNPGGIDGNQPNGREVVRMTGYGFTGMGPRFNNTQVPVGLGQGQPQSLLHLNINDNWQSWLQISNQATGQTVFDGVRLGVVGSIQDVNNPLFISTNFNPFPNAVGIGMLYNQENKPLLFSTGAATNSFGGANTTSERVRLMSAGTITQLAGAAYGVNNPGGVNPNFTRMSISHNPLTPVTRPLSLMHLGYNTTQATNDGWRPWMDVGMFVSYATDNMYIGMKREGGLLPFNNRMDAVVGWGDNTDTIGGFPVGPDNLRFIFTSPTTGVFASSPASQADGLETGRFVPDHDTTFTNGVVSWGRFGVGDFSVNGVNEQPTHKLDVIGNGRFRYLPDSLYLADASVTKVVMVDSMGVLRWANAVPSQLGQACGDTTNPAMLASNREVPMNDFNIYFTGQGTPTTNAIGVGYGCGDPMPAKFNVLQNDSTTVSVSTAAGYFQNTDTANIAGLVFRGVVGIAAGPHPQFTIGNITNVGGEFVGTNAQTNFGVRANANFDSIAAINSYGGRFSSIGVHKNNVGAQGIANNSAGDNYGVQGLANNTAPGFGTNFGGHFSASGSSLNYGIYATVQTIDPVPGSLPPASGNYAGYFNGSVLRTGNDNFSSDSILKINVDTLHDALAIIEQLKPRSYYYDTTNAYGMEFSTKKQYGFVAQHVETVLPELVSSATHPATYDTLGNVVTAALTYKTLQYQAFIALLTKGLQEQQSQIDSITNENDNLDSILNALHFKNVEQDSLLALQDSVNQSLQDQINTLYNMITSCCSNGGGQAMQNNNNGSSQNLNATNVELKDVQSVVLDQNVPNPFAEQTTITYTLPTEVKRAQLLFYNAEGKLINTVDLSNQSGKGQINVFANDLSNGIYTYTLIVDGKIIDTKKMVKQQ